MNELGTITQDFRTPVLDCLSRSAQGCGESNRRDASTSQRLLPRALLRHIQAERTLDALRR